MSLDKKWPDEEELVAALVDEGVVRHADVERARKLHGNADRGLLLSLNVIGKLSDDQMAQKLSAEIGLPIFEADIEVDEAISERLSPQFLKANHCIPLTSANHIGIVNPLAPRIREALTYAIGCEPDVQIIRHRDWRKGMAALFSSRGDLDEGVADADDEAFDANLLDQTRDAPVVALVNEWLSGAADMGASDIHIGVRDGELIVQYRIDGLLRLVDRKPRGLCTSVMARLKVIANLDLGERNRPQDGRTSIVVRGRPLDLRLSMLLTINGEAAVIRLLDRPTDLLSLDRLGFDHVLQNELTSIAHAKHGLFIVAGPTGSGKTTTLYAMLQAMAGKGLKILSVEDPVEYQFDHVDQMQVSERAGRTFATALRAFLRHDPDVIVVGEIRDAETAQIAVQAALTGHLVLASLHAIDTARVASRLIDLGVEPYQLEACLIGAMAQRLVRLLCTQCAEPSPPTDAETAAFLTAKLPVPETLYAAKGCDACGGAGFQGRMVIAELQSGEHSSSPVSHCALKLASEGDIAMVDALGLGGA